MAKKILIVDDENDPIAYLDTLFKENGYETAIARNGEEALPIAKDFKPDVVTLDIIMPEQSGIKFYRNLKKDPQLSDVPVIIISGATRYQELFKRNHATMAKPFAFIEKPIDVSELLETVEKALE